MKLIELRKLLGQVKPALADDPLSRIFSYLWFDGKNVTAFNGLSLAIRVPCPLKYTGALPGKVLTDIVDKVVADEVEIVEEKDGNARLTAGKTSVKLATEDWTSGEKVLADLPFKPGKAHRQLKVKRGKDLLTAMQCCDLSLGTDTMRRDTVAVCLRADPEEPYLLLFATNSFTLSRSDVPVEGDKPPVLPKEGLWLPTEFCQQIVRYLTVSEDFTLYVSDEQALFASGNVSIYTQFSPPAASVDFEGILAHHFPSKRKKSTVPLAPELRPILERACVFVNTKLDAQARTSIEVAKGVAYFISESGLGRVEDELAMNGHPDTQLRVDPKRLLTAFDFYFGDDEKHRGHIVFDPECAVLVRDPDMYHLVSTFGS